jgi:hypothetical protein
MESSTALLFRNSLGFLQSFASPLVSFIYKALKRARPVDRHGRWWQFITIGFFSKKVFGEMSKKGFLKGVFLENA